jgi:hypothetical protein
LNKGAAFQEEPRHSAKQAKNSGKLPFNIYSWAYRWRLFLLCDAQFTASPNADVPAQRAAGRECFGGG